MKLKIIELEKEKIQLVLEGEGHTFVNALVEELLLDEDVDVAKYVIEFQFSDPELMVTMKPEAKKDAATAILEAAQRINTRCDDLLSWLKN